MNLRDLQYLTTVAETLHFGQAAARLNVSQPTLSMQLKKLEETLGVQLFERSNKHVLLTPAGTQMVAHAHRVLDAAEALKHAAQSARDPLGGTLRLGLFPTLAPYLLPLLIPCIQADLPNLTLQLVEEKTPEILHQLASGTLDAALLALPVTEAGLTSLPVFTEPFMLAVAPFHPLAARRYVRVDDIAHESVLLLEDGHCLRDQALDICHRVGVADEGNFRATSLETLRHMVATSNAVTLMPALAARQNDGVARYLPFAQPSPSRTIGLVWRRTSAKSQLFNALVNCIATAYDAAKP